MTQVPTNSDGMAYRDVATLEGVVKRLTRIEERMNVIVATFRGYPEHMAALAEDLVEMKNDIAKLKYGRDDA